MTCKSIAWTTSVSLLPSQIVILLKTHERVLLLEQHPQVVHIGMEHRVGIEVGQHSGQAVRRDPPLAIRVGGVRSAVLSRKDLDTSREQVGVAVVVALNHGLSCTAAQSFVEKGMRVIGNRKLGSP
jgi:hypothetical protein